jgi:hypothetical protein
LAKAMTFAPAAGVAFVFSDISAAPDRVEE